MENNMIVNHITSGHDNDKMATAYINDRASIIYRNIYICWIRHVLNKTNGTQNIYDNVLCVITNNDLILVEQKH